jgi:tetratricopeptide (TPR) repeat protein
VSRLRSLLSKECDVELASRSGGYSLAVDPTRIDAHSFERLVAQARREADEGAPEAASATFDRALALWRGHVLADLHHQPDPAAATRLEQMRLAAVEERVDIDLALGRHVDLAPELEVLTEAHPFRERLWGQLIVALYRAGRQGDALAAYQRVRATLVDELGIEPGPELRAVERHVLDQADQLRWPAGAMPADRGGRTVPPRRQGSPTGAAPQVPLPAALAHPAHDRLLVGRGVERTLLDLSLEVARAGHVSAVLVGGPPGIGKTSLLAWLARAAHADGATVLLGRSDQGSTAPFQAITEAMSHWLRHASSADLERLGPEARQELARLAPALADPSGPSARPLWPGGEADRQLLFEAVERWVETVAALPGAPALLMFEDIHWADPATLLALRHLVRHPPRAGALIVAAHRDDGDGPAPLAAFLADTRSDAHVQRIHLGSLAAGDVAELLGALGDRPPDGDDHALAAQLTRFTGGNPLFVHEALRHLTERGAVGRSGRRQLTHRSLESFGVPTAVREVIEQRLRGLPAATVVALRQASVLGQRFDLPVLAQVMRSSDVEAADALEPALAAGLVEAEGDRPGRLGFRHALVHQVTFDGLPLNERTRVHWRAGQAIADRHPAPSASHLAELAHHLALGARAGEPHTAVRANVEAGQAALAALAFEDATCRFRAALDLADESGTDDAELSYQAWLGIGHAAGALGDADGQGSGFRNAAVLARDNGWGKRLVAATIGFRSYVAEAIGPLRPHDDQLQTTRLAQDLMQDALAAVGEAPSADRCLLLALRASSAVILDDGEPASALAAAALTTARALGDPDLEATALIAHLWATIGAPHQPELSDLPEQALAVPSPPHHRDAHREYVVPVLPLASLQTGDRARFDAIRAQVARHPDTRRSAHLTALVRGWEVAMATCAGRFDEAERLVASAPGSGSGSGGWGLWQAVTLLQRAVVALEQGHDEAVAPALRDYLAANPGTASTLAMLATVDAAAGRTESSLGHVRELRARRSLTDLGGAAPLTLRHLAEVAAHLGVGEPGGGPSAEMAAELLPILSGYEGQMLVSLGGLTVDAAADRALGQALLALGRHDEAVRRLTSARDLERSFGADALAARTTYWLAHTRLERADPGDAEAARRLLDETASVTRRLGMAGLGRAVDALQATAG